MGISDIDSQEPVLRALEEFDRLGRTAFLGKYGFGPARGYFVLHEGGRYDSKAIVGAAHGFATGVPLGPDDFSGGDRTVAKLLESLGFSVERPTSSPDWTMDELILALDLYLRTKGEISYSPRVPEVIQLSSTLRGLRIFPSEITELEKFRNPDGVALKLHNLSSVDPSHPGRGMTHGGRLDQVVWDTWAHRPAELQAAAALIRAHGSADIAGTETGEEEEFAAEEGRLLFRRHRARERDRKVVKRKLEAVLAATGMLRCEVCELDTSEFYGEVAEGVVDVHHVVPLHLAGESVTRLKDLAVVCPTCHRVLHRHRPIITPAELGAKLRARGMRAATAP